MENRDLIVSLYEQLLTVHLESFITFCLLYIRCLSVSFSPSGLFLFVHQMASLAFLQFFSSILFPNSENAWFFICSSFLTYKGSGWKIQNVWKEEWKPWSLWSPKASGIRPFTGCRGVGTIRRNNPLYMTDFKILRTCVHAYELFKGAACTHVRTYAKKRNSSHK